MMAISCVVAWNLTGGFILCFAVIKPERIWLPELALMNGYVFFSFCLEFPPASSFP